MLLDSTLKRLLRGCMLGDSLGLPAEGMSKETLKNLRWTQHWRQRLFFGRGMLSDDSEHSFMLAAALIESRLEPQKFQQAFARKLKFWLLGLPAGIGLGTLRSLIKLWFFFPPGSSGVQSAGNGPSMRSALLGIVFAQDAEKRRQFCDLSSSITHSDERALIGARAIADAASLIFNRSEPLSLQAWAACLKACGDNAEWHELIEKMMDSLNQGFSVEAFADSIGCHKGVSGFVYHSVPVALYAVISHPDDFSRCLTSVLDLGGDTDTVGAICGALVAVSDGKPLPGEWLEGICEWPRSAQKYDRIAEDLARVIELQVPLNQWSFFAPLLLIRNLLFIPLVLAHGFLRLLPASLIRRLIP